MVTCLVSKCRHNISKNQCRFFTVPKDPKLLSRWKRHLDLSMELISSHKDPRICSCHFPHHKKENEPIIKDPSTTNNLWIDYSSLIKTKKTEVLKSKRVKRVISPSVKAKLNELIMSCSSLSSLKPSSMNTVIVRATIENDVRCSRSAARPEIEFVNVAMEISNKYVNETIENLKHTLP